MEQRSFVLLLVVLNFFFLPSFSQYQGRHSIAIESLYSTGDELPFWLVHNKSGKYGMAGYAVQALELQTHNRFNRIFSSGIDLKFGTDLIGTYTNDFNGHFNELYGGIHFWNLFKLEGGLFREEELGNGLSSTNMILDRSLNARPYPKIRFATDGFVNPFFWKEWLLFKAEYDEGLLDDYRYVDETHLHHKSLYFNFRFNESVDFTCGLNHFVMWGGTSSKHGELPGIESYFLYVTGKPGDSTFLNTDQLNIAGNQFGSYYLQLNIDKPGYALTFYLSHPFDDKSGMEGDNWRDNLIGAFIDLKQKSIVEKAVYEFMYTIHQSGDTHLFGYMRGRDNYYNHGIYRSGYTYRGYAMCTPVFSPLLFNDEGMVTNISNTRIAMHHIGIMGTLAKIINWDTRLTFTHNLGTYNVPFEPAKNQFSMLLNLGYVKQKLPVDITLSLAADFGALYPNRVGAMLRLSKSW